MTTIRTVDLGLATPGKDHVQPRKIIRRTRGNRHGPITRLMSPSDLGQVLKPFVFLDLFDMEHATFQGMGLHPHSGIATVSYLFDSTCLWRADGRHGTQKLFGWLGGYGIAGTGQFFDGIGFRPGSTFAAVAALAEFFGGLLLVLGLVQPLAAILIISVMITAIGSVHLGHGWFAATNGPEVPILYAAAAAAVTLTGPSAYSGDAVFVLLPLRSPTLKLAAIAIGIAGGVMNLAIRRPAAQPA